jgi:hypothetical protein
MSLYDAGLWTIALTIAVITLATAVAAIRNNSFQAGYWRGRGDGWRLANRHRDLVVSLKDEVFDYDKQN